MTPNRKEIKKFVRLYEKHGSIKAVARNTDKSYNYWQDLYEAAVAEGLMDPIRPGRKSVDHIHKVISGDLHATKAAEAAVVVEGHLRAPKYRPLPRKKRGVTRFLFTSQQNNTPVHAQFWDNLLAFKDEIGATLHVSQFAYIKSGLGASGDKSRWLNNEKYRESRDIYFDPKTQPYLCNDRVQVAPGLVFCGDQNILPTAVRPLSGYEVFTGRASGIFPHVKIAMESIATVNTEEPTKFNYTTGTVTMRNYIQRRLGMLADFHHCFGALLVEVTQDGDWFVRQINADSEGTFYDLDTKVENGKVTHGHRIEALTAGDVHVAEIDEAVKKATWGKGGLVDTLKPKFQIIHDVLDFHSRSHHSIKNPHLKFLRHVTKTESVREELMGVADFLQDAYRDWCKTVVVDSNHDRHIGRWLAEQDGREDPINAQVWLELQRMTYAAMAELGEQPNHLQLAVRLVNPAIEDKLGVLFLPADGSYIICKDFGGGIECGLHGDRGPNGSRGSARGLSRMGRKANIGHSHSACISDGVYQSGTSSKLRLEYNVGPSNWSHAHIITYPNGKRAVITLWKGRWRA